MARSKNTIFIQIASYRDPQLVPTIKDCLKNAKYPKNLVFSIAWQHSDEDKWDNLDEFKDDPRFKIIDIPYKESKGACWARHALQQQYNGEKYTLQLDSHHRFVKNWDVELISMVKQLQKKGHKKPLLTSYASSFDPDNDPEARIMEPWWMTFDRFIPEGAVFFLPATIPGWENITKPVPARFYSAHFCFTLGQFAKEVQHDPNLYFHGEEISIAVRAYTHGYDLFHPHKVIVWHEYTRKGRTKQWDDDSDWVNKNNKSHLRNRTLLEMEGKCECEMDFEHYGLGTQRTRQDYEKYAGIRFTDRGVQQHTLDNKFPPNPEVGDYDNSFHNIFKHCVDLHAPNFPETDYDFWAVIFEDEDGKEIYRQDADVNEIKNLLELSKKDNDWIRLWRTYTGKKPNKWVVWPHSVSKDWCERIEGTL